MSRLAESLPRLDRRSAWALALLFAGLALAAWARATLLGVGGPTPAELEGAPRELVFPAVGDRGVDR